MLPKEWDDTVTITRQSATDGSTVSFYRYGTSDPTPFLDISVLTNSARTAQPLREGRLLLTRQADAVYSAEIFDSSMIDEETLYASFALLMTEWTTGEN